MIDKKIRELILNDSYVLWLSSFLEKHFEFDDIYFVHENRLSEENVYFIDNLKFIFNELNKYAVKNKPSISNMFSYYLKYNHSIYHIYYNSEGYSCRKVSSNNNILCIDYDEFKKTYIKDNSINFETSEELIPAYEDTSEIPKVLYIGGRQYVLVQNTQANQTNN